ncbi:HpcH/HpaI aldolase/citrate lyase family protein [Candidatus Margulisiibacteriota bacterium]
MKDLKNRLKNNQLSVGSWITLGHPSVAEIMAQADFDWLTIDLEHSAITLDQAQSLIQVIDLSGCTPLVRVGENDPNLIKRVMDAGACGVIIPMVNSKEEAEKAVKAVKYPPIGTRGVGLARAQGYGFKFDQYKDWVNKESLVIVQIEHIKAIENLEEILNVPGVDGSIIGPYDLSGSMGYPGEFERPEVQEALKRYEDICSKMNKPKGIHVVQPDAAKANRYIKSGYSLLAFGVDMLFLGQKCRNELKKVRENR